MASKSAKPGPAGCETCGQSPVLKYKNFQFFWSEGINMELGELPADSILEIHPTFILVSVKDGWKVMIPMDHILFINVSDPL